MPREVYDAVVIGSGPNGLAAAISLALNNLSVLVLEEKAVIGGGCRSEELTLPQYIHDVCSSIHPLALGSPFFRRLPLAYYGLRWVHPSAPLAHPFDKGVLLLERSIEQTAEAMQKDSRAYKNLIGPFVRNWPQLEDVLLGPFSFPRHPLSVLQFGIKALRSAKSLAKDTFQTEKAMGLFAGIAAHSFLPLDRSLSSAFGLVLGTLGHVYGWPLPVGGSQAIADALGRYFQFLGGVISTNTPVSSLKQLPSTRVVLFDLTPKQILQIAEKELSANDQRQLRKYRYGPGVFKMDWALASPIPWKARECLRAGTVHIGGTLEEISASEKAIWNGGHVDKPYVLLAQHSLFDPSRAPPGKQTAWAYCHVPHGSKKDMTAEIESQIERFAPGFRDCILAKSVKNTEAMEEYNSNYIGGDIIGGVQDLWQLFTRPTNRLVPYATSNPRLFICSSSSPPGGGVHGMCGYHAAKTVLKHVFGVQFGWNQLTEKTGCIN